MTRRPEESRRELLAVAIDDERSWYNKYPKMLGNMLKTEEQRDLVKRLIDTYHDIFTDSHSYIRADRSTLLMLSVSYMFSKRLLKGGYRGPANA